MGRKAILTIWMMLAILGIFALEAQADWQYTVRRGDTLYEIARKTGISPNTLRSHNGMGSNRLRIGQRLTIPTGAATARRTPTRTGADVNLLAHLIFAEAGQEPYLGKVAVGGVIMNRLEHPRFPKTIAGVIYQPHAFESVSNGIIDRSPNNDAFKAAVNAISGWDPSGGALYFFNPAKTNNPWIWARRIINRIGKHVFAI